MGRHFLRDPIWHWTVYGGIRPAARAGPFAWNGFFDFWLAAGAFFAWLVVMTPLVLRAIRESEPGLREKQN